MKFRRIAPFLLVSALALTLTSCLTQRTVTQGGRTVKQGYVLKNPVNNSTMR